ncbi:TadE/TadG family type IV pilus assembly protein [uncultured Erythrobacter sp.]|uniref:TadE/TadG family type IV pilus assembly protein n=1 Tax=uncultured Erythrobacter sp. TaxID=263913 RepID=UPI0026598B51|nr:TadE/TadG family type IV pilus assembly protein [uncultured Erythrobacter sp.]
MFIRDTLINRNLGRDMSGATIVEFAVVAPIFFGILMFIFDMGFMAYARSILSGEVNAVGRASALETATDQRRAEMDARVAEKVRLIAPDGAVTFERDAFNSYGLAQTRVEPFVDDNENDRCDAGERYLDLNGNSRFDLNGARAGGGGARDVVIYTVTLRYTRFFPLAEIFGMNRNVEIQERTILKNQPFDQQSQPTSGVCV